jgi:hypothetical protein
VQRTFWWRDIAELVSTQQFALATRVAQDLDADLNFSLTAIMRSAEAMPRELLTNPEKFRQFVAGNRHRYGARLFDPSPRTTRESVADACG